MEQMVKCLRARLEDGNCDPLYIKIWVEPCDPTIPDLRRQSQLDPWNLLVS